MNGPAERWPTAGGSNSQSNSPVGTLDHVHQFCHLLSLFIGIAAGNRVMHAMADMIFQHSFLDATEGGTHRRDLRDYVDTISLLLDHPRNPADLAFDFVQSFEAGICCVVFHA